MVTSLVRHTMKEHRYKVLKLFFDHHGYLANQDLIYRKAVIKELERCGHEPVYPDNTDYEHLINKTDYNLRLGTFEVPLMCKGGYFIVRGIERVLLIQEHRSRHIVFTGIQDDITFTETRLRGARNALKLLYSADVRIKVLLEGGRDTTYINLLNLFYRWKNRLDPIEIVKEVFKQSKWKEIMLAVLDDKTIRSMDISDDMYEYISKSTMGSSTVEEITYTLLYMLERCIGATFDKSYLSDRDHCGSKIYHTSGTIINTLMNRAFSRDSGNIRSRMEKEVYSVIRTGVVEVYGKMESDMASSLGRRSTLDSISMVRRVVVPANVNSTITEMRQYHRSQNKFLCPCETPEGKEVGLIRSLAMTCVVSPIMGDIYDRLKDIISEVPSSHGMVIYNGMVIGFSNGDNYLEIKSMKMEYPYMSINKDIDGNINVRTYPNRLMRPVIATYGKLFKWSSVNTTNISWNDMIKDGVIEYIDATEADHLTIADMSYEGNYKKYTHMEIHSVAMLGIAASCIPLIGHNPGARGTFATSMSKQALESSFRLDDIHDTHMLCYGQRPLVGTCTQDLLSLPPNGINVVIAMMAWDGSNMEDAIIVNRAFVERGGMMTLRRETGTIPSDMGNRRIVVVNGDSMKDGFKYGIGEKGKKNYWIIDGPPDGRSASLYRHHKMVGESTLTSTTLRYGSVGDKASSRHGQKGVVGMLAEQQDLPFDKDGISPDIIINPHGIPSRMTVGHLMEMVLGMKCAKDGRFVDATGYNTIIGDPKDKKYSMAVGDITDELKVMYDGRTGLKLPNMVSMGIIYYMIMPHQVDNKIYTRGGRGPKDALSHQPVGGKAKDGGLRWGEMEKDATVAQGLSHVVHDFQKNSDLEDVGVCSGCGDFPVTVCEKCKEGTKINTVNMSYSMVVLNSMMKSINIRTSLK